MPHRLWYWGVLGYDIATEMAAEMAGQMIRMAAVRTSFHCTGSCHCLIIINRVCQLSLFSSCKHLVFEYLVTLLHISMLNLVGLFSAFRVDLGWGEITAKALITD